MNMLKNGHIVTGSLMSLKVFIDEKLEGCTYLYS